MVEMKRKNEETKRKNVDEILALKGEWTDEEEAYGGGSIHRAEQPRWKVPYQP